MAEIYGGEHLLRLFGTPDSLTSALVILLTCRTVSMPELIAQTNMDHQAVVRLREELSSMTTWLSRDKQVNTFFASIYESPGQAYIDKVKSST
jgi:mortality factor 4-like protein 1